ncbi:MAG: hypothetical protein ABH885_03750, partial [Candidatus Omnitrophota bacterium]
HKQDKAYIINKLDTLANGDRSWKVRYFAIQFLGNPINKQYGIDPRRYETMQKAYEVFNEMDAETLDALSSAKARPVRDCLKIILPMSIRDEDSMVRTHAAILMASIRPEDARQCLQRAFQAEKNEDVSVAIAESMALICPVNASVLVSAVSDVEGSLVYRIRICERICEIVNDWAGPAGVIAADDVEALKDDIGRARELIGNMADYATEHVPGVRVTDEDRRAMSAMYVRIEKMLGSVEHRMSEQERFIQQHITECAKKMTDNLSVISNDIEELCLEREWLGAFFRSMDDVIARVRGLLERNDAEIVENTGSPYLSYSDYEALEREACDMLDKMEDAVLHVDGYKQALMNIQKAVEAAQKLGEVSGGLIDLSQCAAGLKDLSGLLLNSAYQGREYGQIDAGYRNLSADLPTRTAFLSRCSDMIIEVKAITDPVGDGMELRLVSNEEKRRQRDRVFGMIVDEIRVSPLGSEIGAWLTGDHSIQVTEGLYEEVSSYMRRKALLGRNLIELDMEAMDFQMLLGRADATARGDTLAHVTELRSDIAGLLDELSDARVFSVRQGGGGNDYILGVSSESPLRGMQARYSSYRTGLQNIRDSFRAAWSERISEEAGIVQCAANLWAHDWLGGFGDNEILARLTQTFRMDNRAGMWRAFKEGIQTLYAAHASRVASFGCYKIFALDDMLRNDSMRQELIRLIRGIYSDFGTDERIYFFIRTNTGEDGTYLADLELNILICNDAAIREVMGEAKQMESHEVIYRLENSVTDPRKCGKIKISFNRQQLYESSPNLKIYRYDEFTSGQMGWRYQNIKRVLSHFLEIRDETNRWIAQGNQTRISDARGFLCIDLENQKKIGTACRAMAARKGVALDWEAPDRVMVLPKYDQSGRVREMVLCLFNTAAASKSVIMISTDDAAPAPYWRFSEFDDRAAMAIIIDLGIDLRNHMLRLNGITVSGPHADERPMIFPEYMFRFVIAALSHYESVSGMTPEECILSGTPVDAREVLKSFLRSGALRDMRAPLPSDMSPARVTLNTAQEQLRDKTADTAVTDLITAYEESLGMSGRSDDCVRQFARSCITMLHLLSGREYDTDPADIFTQQRIIPTLDETSEQEIDVFAKYPPLEQYNGIFLDTKDLTFYVKDSRLSEQSAALAGLLNRSLREYLAVLRGLTADRCREDLISKVSKELDRICEAIASGLAITVAVSDSLPVNSLIVDGNTIFLDRAFAEFLIAAERDAKTAGAARIVMAERIMHELGHAELMPKSLGFEEEENIQLWRDALFYKALFESVPGLAGIVNKFTHGIVRTGEKEGAKFSGAFRTRVLFRAMQGWAESMFTDPENVKEKIAQFVKKYVVPMYRRPSTVRMFPAAEGCGPGAGAVFGLHDANIIAEWEDIILRGMTRQGAPFLEATQRRIVISINLVPQCQRGMVDEINDKSREAFRSGWTRDLIEILPLSEIRNIRSSETVDIVALISEDDAIQYGNNEKRLVFKPGSGGPVLIPGLIAAGRAVLYGDMELLLEIMAKLGGRRIDTIDAASLSGMLARGEYAQFAKALSISLQSITVSSEDSDSFNRSLLRLIRFA